MQEQSSLALKGHAPKLVIVTSVWTCLSSEFKSYENYEERAFFPCLRRDEDERIIRAINDNYDYINMQFR